MRPSLFPPPPGPVLTIFSLLFLLPSLQERWFVLDIASMSIPYYTSENEQLSELKGMVNKRRKTAAICDENLWYLLLPSEDSS